MAFDPGTGLPVQQQANEGNTSSGYPSSSNAFTINVPPAPPAPPRHITEEEFLTALEKVRKEEKDKLYPHIEDLQGQLALLTREREERIAIETASQQQAAEIERQRQESEMTALQQLQAHQTDMDRRFAEVEAERDRERAMRVKEAEYAQIQEYRLRRLSEESDRLTIAPQFLDYVQGSSQEEIERSIQIVQDKTAQIAAEVQAAQSLAQPRRQVGLPISGGPPVEQADMANLGGRQMTLTAEQIRDMNMADYAEVRSQLMAAQSERVRQVGPYAP